MPLMAKRVLAVIPAYNEEENIVETVEELKHFAPHVDYVVINDGSRDKTAALCEEHGYNLISLPLNVGLAGAFQTGIKYAYREGYDYALQFDADGQHSAAHIDTLLSEAYKSKAHIIIGSRFVAEKKPFSARMFGSTVISAMIKLTTGKKIQDPTSGMRLLNSEMIPLFAQELDYSPNLTPSRCSYVRVLMCGKCR